MQSETFARELYARWDSFFEQNFERIADEILSKHDKSGHIIEIEKLELDLGDFTESGFYENFPLRIREKLEESLLQALYNPAKQNIIQKKTQPIYLLDILTQFLRSGTLPVNTPPEYRNIAQLFSAVVRQESAGLKKFLQTYGHYSALQQRLVYQLDNPELEKGVELLNPSQAVFINSYVQLLRAKYKAIEKPQLQETAHRNAVWLVVYAYLLSNSSSYFNRKSFVTQTILRLAAQYNSNYGELLRTITSELAAYSKQLAMPPELFLILQELKQELSENQWQKSTINAAGFFKTIYASILKNNTPVTTDARESLIRILSRADSCRLFLQQLKEDEIIRLVAIVMPAESDFIIQTAQLVEKGKIKNETSEASQQKLEGKTGGEFRLLKWQIIFPLLLQNRGAAFNRRYFVENFLKQIAAHYNLAYPDLLGYVCQSREQFDASLQQILTFLLEKETPETAAKKPETAFSAQKEEDYIALIHKHFPAESGFIIAYAQQLDAASEKGMLKEKSGSGFRLLKWQFILKTLGKLQESAFNRNCFVENILKQIATHYNLAYPDLLGYIYQIREQSDASLQQAVSFLLEKETPETAAQKPEIAFSAQKEEDYIALIHKHFPDESGFIIAYAQQLDAANEKGMLEGKAGSGFRLLKWQFIVKTLDKLRESSFNRRYFIENILKQIAAHYNLSYFDLLIYFQTPAVAPFVPFRLQTLLAELFEQEKEHWVNSALINSAESEKLKLVKILLPAEYAFVKLYAQTLLQFNEKEKLQGKLSGDFQQLKWRFIFEVLFESQKIAFNKKQFIESTLGRIAAHYNLTVSDLIAWLRENGQLSQTARYKEIAVIFDELYKRKITSQKPNLNIMEKYILTDPANKAEQELLEKLSQQKEFLSYASDILKLLPGIQKFLSATFRLSLNMEKILESLLKSASEYRQLSYAQITIRLLESIAEQLNTQQKTIFYQSIEKWCKAQNLQSIVREYQKQEQKTGNGERNLQESQLPETENNAVETAGNNEEISEPQFINNAGIVLLAPYLPRLFNMLQLTENNRFKDSEAQIRAMFLLQHAVFGIIAFPEHEMTLNKLLTGFDVAETIPQTVELTPHEKETVENMLKGALQNWQKLRNTSIEGFRAAFLQRNGKLEEKDDFYQLTVEDKAYDVLLDTCPWNFRTIKFPWMKKMIQVKWR